MKYIWLFSCLAVMEISGCLPDIRRPAVSMDHPEPGPNCGTQKICCATAEGTGDATTYLHQCMPSSDCLQSDIGFIVKDSLCTISDDE